MSEVTRILSAIEVGDPQAAEKLLPLVYEELRKLAAQKLAQEKPGQTLQATELQAQPPGPRGEPSTPRTPRSRPRSAAAPRSAAVSEQS